MVIEVFGLPCTKIDRTLLNVEEAVRAYGDDVTVVFVSDIHKMSERGIVHQPSIVVNGVLKSSGRIPSVYEIARWVEEEIETDVAA